MELWMFMVALIVYGAATLFASYMLSEGLNADGCDVKYAKKANMGLMSIGAMMLGFGVGALIVLRILRKHTSDFSTSGIRFSAIFILISLLALVSLVLVILILVGMGKDDKCSGNKTWAFVLLAIDIIAIVSSVAFMIYRYKTHGSITAALTGGAKYRMRG